MKNLIYLFLCDSRCGGSYLGMWKMLVNHKSTVGWP